MLPAFRITCADGYNYVTSMAVGVTLADAKSYFLGQRSVREDSRGVETSCKVIQVEQV